MKKNRFLWLAETHFLLFILEPGALHTLQSVNVNAVRNPERLPNHQHETLSTTRLRGKWGTGSWWGWCAESLPTPVQASKSRARKWLQFHTDHLISLTTHIYRLNISFFTLATAHRWWFHHTWGHFSRAPKKNSINRLKETCHVSWSSLLRVSWWK